MKKFLHELLNLMIKWNEFLDQVLYLNKFFYKLKQVSRIWYLFLCEMIIELGFVSYETDFCIYIRGDIIIEIFVDDMKIVASIME